MKHAPEAAATPRLLKISEVAARLNLSLRTVWCHVASGRLRVIRLGRRSTRVEPSEVERFLDAARDAEPRR